MLSAPALMQSWYSGWWSGRAPPGVMNTLLNALFAVSPWLMVPPNQSVLVRRAGTAA
jgi:hypothetical protein